LKLSLSDKNVVLILAIDIILIIFSLYGAYLIRFEFDVPLEFMSGLKSIIPIVLLIKVFVFYFFDLYRGMWRYTSMTDLVNIIKAAFGSTVLIVSIVVFSNRFIGFSRSIFIIDCCFTIFLISGFRLAVRIFFEHASENESGKKTVHFLYDLFRHGSKKKKLIIIGAGDCGEKIFREIKSNSVLGYSVVGFLDDQPVKKGKKIHGVPVLGPVSEVKAIGEKQNADELLIATPSANSEQMRQIVHFCKDSGLRFKTIPGYGELINGRVTVNSIREVAYKDLLGREEISLDEKKIGSYLKNQIVLITGAGGSIGSELCRQVCKYKPEKILLFERAESSLYDIELELKKNFKHIKVVPLLADVKDRSHTENIFKKYSPAIVFHAAAYKHVPMLEMQPHKAIENNILGTGNIIEISEKYGVERFVFVSTDKAVRPTNVMGASKRVAEMLIQSRIESNTRYMIVRFGNVVGSVGSVVPLFKKQIKEGGPVTVTHPEITRYFMMITEACQLILQAGALGETNNVEIFLLEMGKPIKIDDMAHDLIRFSGFEPGKDIKIEYSGLRPGEKLYEELITDGEDVVPTSHEKIMVLRSGDLIDEKIKRGIDNLIHAPDEYGDAIIKQKLKEIVPEYIISNNTT
jgi:FlaA1/EpsC-like NDP-sugar epimerase